MTRFRLLRSSPARGPVTLLAVLLVACTPAIAGEVYQWKDANGVTHYSDSPPAGSQYESRQLAVRDPQVTSADAGAPTENPNCQSARANLSQLESGGPVGIDEDGDGKADGTLNDAQRAAQKQLAEAAIRVHCTAPAAASGNDGDA